LNFSLRRSFSAEGKQGEQIQFAILFFKCKSQYLKYQWSKCGKYGGTYAGSCDYMQRQFRR